MNEDQMYLRQVFMKALAAGLCRKQGEFAALVGVNDKSLSSAMNGNPRILTKSLIRKVQAWAIINGLEDMEPRQNTPAQPAKPSEPEPYYQTIIESQQRTIEALTATVDRQSRLLEIKFISPYTGLGIVPRHDDVQKKSHPDQDGK